MEFYDRNNALTHIFTPFYISNADLTTQKIRKSVKSIVGISPTMVLLFHLHLCKSNLHFYDNRIRMLPFLRKSHMNTNMIGYHILSDTWPRLQQGPLSYAASYHSHPM